LRSSEPILIRNITIVDSEVIKTNTSVCIEDSIIENVGGKCSKTGIVIDGKGGIVTPPFYIAHIHSGLYPISRITGQWTHLDEWASNIAWRWEPRLTPTDSYYSAILALYNYIRQGAAGVADMHFNMDSVARAVELSGIRANISVAIMNRGFYDDEWKALEDNLRLHSSWNNRDGRIKVSLGPCTIRFVSRSLLEEISRIRSTENIGVHMHVGEVWEDEEYSLRNYGVKAIRFLEKLGLLGRDTIIAHGVWLDDAELTILAKYKSILAHNPTTNMLLGSGIARTRRMLQLGVKLALGLDISPTQEIVNEVLSAIAVSRLIGEPISPKDVFDMLTLYGSGITGVKKIGLVRKGYAADVLLWVRNAKPRTNIYEDLLLGAYKPHTLIVNGKIVMESMEVKTISKHLLSEASKHLEEKIQQLLDELYG